MSEDATGSGLGGSSGAPAAGGSTGAGVAGGAAAAVRSPNGGASRLGRLVSGLPLPVHDHETPSTGGELDAYLTPAAGDALFLTQDEGDLRYLPLAYTPPAVDLSGYEQVARKGQPDGYAPLEAGGKIPSVHLPPLAITETFVVASQAAMLALTAQVGDVCVRTDQGQTYILAAEPAATLANWTTITNASGVDSVNGQTGTVSLGYADVGAAAVDHTHPSEESGQWRFQDTTTIANPGAGYLRCNTGALATATVLSLSRTTQDGYDIPPPGWGITAGDTIYVQDRDDSTKWVRYTALEPLVRYPTYATGLVTVIGSAGAVIANGQLLEVTFSLAGGGGGGGGGGLAADALWGAKGDLVAASANDAAARLAVGSNGQVLTADSAQTLGVKWAAAPGLDQTTADARYLQLAAGGTVAGATSFTTRLTVAGGAQPKISVQSGAPSSPATGDVWIW